MKGGLSTPLNGTIIELMLKLPVRASLIWCNIYVDNIDSAVKEIVVRRDDCTFIELGKAVSK